MGKDRATSSWKGVSFSEDEHCPKYDTLYLEVLVQTGVELEEKRSWCGRGMPFFQKL
jgi:hypothetical protein